MLIADSDCLISVLSAFRLTNQFTQVPTQDLISIGVGDNEVDNDPPYLLVQVSVPPVDEDATMVMDLL